MKGCPGKNSEIERHRQVARLGTRRCERDHSSSGYAAAHKKSLVRPGELFKSLQTTRQLGCAIDDAAISVPRMTSRVTMIGCRSSAASCAVSHLN